MNHLITEEEFLKLQDQVWEQFLNLWTTYTYPQTASPQDLDRLQTDYDPTPSEGCNHKWTVYQGFSESYEYCKTCDLKRK